MRVLRSLLQALSLTSQNCYENEMCLATTRLLASADKAAPAEPPSTPQTTDVCTTDADCSSGVGIKSCAQNGNCVNAGRLSMRLSWVGDEDYDLYVVTPCGTQVYWDNPVDTVTGAIQDVDSRGEGGNVSNVENIYFSDPSVFPSGNFTYFVDTFDQVGTLSAWTLQLRVNGVLWNNMTKAGKGNSTVFNYISNDGGVAFDSCPGDN